MTDRVNSLVKRAFLTVEAAEAASLGSIPEVDTPHSSEYTEFVSSLLNGTAKTSRPTVKKLIAAIIAAALLVAAVTACAAIKPVREFFEEFFDTYLMLSADDPEPAEKLTPYAPTYLPDGYSCNEESIFDTLYTASWSAGEDYIYYTQMATSDFKALIDTESSEYEKVTVGELTVYRLCKNDIVFVAWASDGYCFTLKCPDALPFTEVEKIFLSVKSNP